MTDIPSPALVPVPPLDELPPWLGSVVRDLATSLRECGLELGALRAAVRARAAELGRRAEEDAARAVESLEHGAYEAAARYCHRAHAASIAAVSLGAVDLESRP